jgi:hypothetical protein
MDDTGRLHCRNQVAVGAQDHRHVHCLGRSINEKLDAIATSVSFSS